MKNKATMDKRTIMSKKGKPMLFIITVLIIFLINKLSLSSYFGFISAADTKNIIRDFEKNYLYYSIFNNDDYIKMKKDLFNHPFTTKSKIYEIITYSKKLSGDDYTEFRYADLLKGKLSYSLSKKMRFQSKKLDDDTVYIKIMSFEENAAKKFFKAMENAKKANYLVLDLRGNSTGYYSEAIQIADDLLPWGMEVVEIEHSNSRHYYNSNSLYFDFNKIFILLDENSAYCSEMIALTLKENLEDRVELVGKSTKGGDIGLIYKSYYNKIGINIASLKWRVKGKGSSEIKKYITNYKDTKLDNLKDYINVIQNLKMAEKKCDLK